MKKTIGLTVFCFFLLLFTSTGVAGEIRTWIAADGQTIEGELVRVSADGKTITLLTTDEKTVDVVIDKLSRADQKHIATQLKKNDNQLQIPGRATLLQVPEDRWANDHYRKFVENVNKFMKLKEAEVNELESREARSDTEASIRLGCYQFGNNRETTAFEHWDRAAARQPKEMAVLIGVAQYARHEFTKARKSIENAIKLGEKDANKFLKEIKEAEKDPPKKVAAAAQPGMGGLGRLGGTATAPVAPKSRPAVKPALPPGSEAALAALRKKIDRVIADDKYKTVLRTIKLSGEEKDAIALYLFLVERELGELKETYSSDGHLALLLMELIEYKEIGRYDGDYNGGFKEYVQVDVYVACLAGYDTAVVLPRTGKIEPEVYALMKKQEAVIAELLPECNRLSGNAHEAEEKLRLSQKSRK